MVEVLRGERDQQAEGRIKTPTALPYIQFTMSYYVIQISQSKKDFPSFRTLSGIRFFV
jgi:hypothetical protein